MPGPGPITRLIPRPKSVTLGGRAFPVWEARLADLADLQAWVDARSPDPLAGLAEAADAAGAGPARDRVLLEAYERAGELAPCYDDAGSPLFTAPEGLAFLVATALRRGTPGLTDEDVAGLIASENGMTPAEFGSLYAAFFGADPRREIERMLEIPAYGGGGDPLTWGEAVDQLAAARNWSYEQIYSLTLTEFVNARRGGKPAGDGFKIPPARFDEFQRRFAAAWGEGVAEPGFAESGGGTGGGWVYPEGVPPGGLEGGGC